MRMLANRMGGGVQKIVVVASQVDDLRVMLDLQQAADEIRVAAFPLFAAAAEQFPAVDDVAAANQRIAGAYFRKRLASRPSTISIRGGCPT